MTRTTSISYTTLFRSLEGVDRFVGHLHGEGVGLVGAIQGEGQQAVVFEVPVKGVVGHGLFSAQRASALFVGLVEQVGEVAEGLRSEEHTSELQSRENL